MNKNTTYFLNLTAGNLFKTKITPAIPAKYYIGLSKAEPAIDGTGASEPAGGAYTRAELTGLSAPAAGVITNGSDLSFPESTADWGVMTHYVIYDALTGGNLLMFGTLSKNRTVETNTVMIIKAGQLSLAVVNG